MSATETGDKQNGSTFLEAIFNAMAGFSSGTAIGAIFAGPLGATLGGLWGGQLALLASLPESGGDSAEYCCS
jgi:hypothetical protein